MEKTGGTDPKNDQIIPGGPHSLWIDTTPGTYHLSLSGDVAVDVAIIGGGIVGLTTAALLKDAGKTVAIIEADRIVRLVTGHTTAKLTSLHGYIYQYLLGRFGEDEAHIYADANQGAINQVEHLIKEKVISCDFKRTSAYTYTETSKNVNLVKREVEAAQKLGLPASYAEATDLPFDIAGAVRLDNQAQFHPRKYLLALAKELPGDGSYLFEKTRALDIEEGETHTVVTDKGDVKAKDVVLATQFPFYDTGFFFARLHPYRSYVLGIRIKGAVPEGMYYSEDNAYHSIRNQPVEGGTVLIIGGAEHVSGQGGDTLKYYHQVERYARERFDVESIDYYWSTEDYNSIDGVPYIGKTPASERIYIATGFGGWGMTNGTLSGMIISDEILGRSNPWGSLFRPSRFKLPASCRSLVSFNANVLKEFTLRLLLVPRSRELSELPRGEGRLMEINHKRVAVYRDDEGEVHALSPVCSHLGCVVDWNTAEKTWDCPCHGSRFTPEGQVLHGPAPTGLLKKNLEGEIT